MIQVIKKVLALLTDSERRSAYLLLGMILVMALLDVVGIASIMPFMAVLANPEIIETNRYLRHVFDEFGFVSAESFLFFLGVVVFITLVLSIGFKAATNWAILQFAHMRNYSISSRLVAGYLRQPYEWFLNRNSSDLGKMALSEVQLVLQGALMPLMHFLAQSAVIIAILCLLLIVDPKLASIVGLGMGGLYGVTFLVFRRLLDRTGKERVAANANRFKAISEAFGGIKEVKLGAHETWALSQFEKPAKHFARTVVVSKLVGNMPRYALEIIAFGGVLLLILYLMRSMESLQQVLPIIALYVMAGYRLMPALQTAYNQATTLRFSGDALDKLNDDLEALRDDSRSVDSMPGSLPFDSGARLVGVTYAYPEAEKPSVTDLNIEIEAKSTIGVVGSTGSGKTTTIDILLGLLEPQTGYLTVDGTEIDSTNRALWQQKLGYVPQDIYLTDDSIAANIAFGVPESKVNRAQVEKVAEIANLRQFVIAELPDGFDTLVGERGVRLSGGQRQRIGIARALYHDPQVLIFDEATSALDTLTEQSVMEAISNLSDEITVILIAHRFATVRNCDVIYVLERGRVSGKGTYDQLVASNEHFRSMAST